MLTLVTSDQQMFLVPPHVACLSETIKNFTDDLGPDVNTIPLQNVSSAILAKVLEYCTHHASRQQSSDTNNKTTEDAWDDEFLNALDMPVLFDVIIAANYLNIKSLLELTCRHVAMMIKGKNPEEIRQTFNITNDFTPEEEAEVRRDNEWVFESARG